MTFDPSLRQVKDEMSTEVVSVESTAPLLTALDLMETKGVTALPVVDQDNHCIGMISAKDIAHIARMSASQLHEYALADEADRPQRISDLIENGMAQKSVHDALRFKLKSVKPETTIATAASKMLLTRFHHLPVLDEQKRLVGIISTLDLLASFVKAAAKRTDKPSSDEISLEDTDC